VFRFLTIAVVNTIFFLLAYYLQICDRIKYPVIVSVLGNVLMLTGFLLVGPAPFITSLVLTTDLVKGVAVIIGVGYSMIMVSTFGRSQAAAIRNGYHNDLDTYLFISSNIIIPKTIKYHFRCFLSLIYMVYLKESKIIIFNPFLNQQYFN
jgi:hypothetical protein